ncbi:PRC-barrel domain-containing protein [Nitrincola sp. A-D6]|uniref:PRC-barrel domain-containing protein n=1 Tax=Nitrincola sp. A-D6 TaxID=1545442 RepID=UPI00190FAD6D|nr:PRC-barrel domain-containing protein [Nitrincola sp. A-D6]
MTTTGRNTTDMPNRGYLESAPVNGTQASDLIGANVRTDADDDIGSVSELIIDESGQVVAILVGVGGFLGMGEKDVAIGWDHITLSGTADDKDLVVDVTSDQLRSAPSFAKR